ncbi:MAG: acyl-CoA thioesterase [Pseudorhodobacter sp.]
MTYRRDIRIEFNHCDPAGIVFYPRYFEMTNSVTENFYRDIAEYPYEAMMPDQEGVPMAGLEARYHAPSRLGEVLNWTLNVTKLGRTSLGLHLEAHCDDVLRVSFDLTQVFVGADGRPKPWPDDIRARIEQFIERSTP